MVGLYELERLFRPKRSCDSMIRGSPRCPRSRRARGSSTAAAQNHYFHTPTYPTAQSQRGSAGTTCSSVKSEATPGSSFAHRNTSLPGQRAQHKHLIQGPRTCPCAGARNRHHAKAPAQTSPAPGPDFPAPSPKGFLSYIPLKAFTSAPFCSSSSTQSVSATMQAQCSGFRVPCIPFTSAPCEGNRD